MYRQLMTQLINGKRKLHSHIKIHPSTSTPMLLKRRGGKVVLNEVLGVCKLIVVCNFFGGEITLLLHHLCKHKIVCCKTIIPISFSRSVHGKNRRHHNYVTLLRAQIMLLDRHHTRMVLFIINFIEKALHQLHKRKNMIKTTSP